MFSLGRVIAAQPGLRYLLRYRLTLVAFAIVSVVLAVLTLGSWEPLRPAFVAGAVSALVVVAAGGRLPERRVRPTSGG